MPKLNWKWQWNRSLNPNRDDIFSHLQNGLEIFGVLSVWNCCRVTTTEEWSYDFATVTMLRLSMLQIPFYPYGVMKNWARGPFDFDLSHKCFTSHSFINKTCKLAPINALSVPLILLAVSSIFHEQKSFPSPLLLFWVKKLLEFLEWGIRNFCW
jgi:hypothetical protein